MNNKKITLATILEQKLGVLLPGELVFIDGLIEVGGTEYNSAIDQSLRTIRSAFVREVVTSSEVRKFINNSLGFHVKEACIEGRLNLSNQNVPFPIHIENSFFKDEIDLQFSKFKVVSFSGSQVQKIIATSAVFQGSLYMQRGFKCNESVNLMAATVGGNLEMNNCILLKDENERALKADAIKIKGGFFMNGSRVNGEIRLLSSKIQGQISFNGSIIKSKSGITVNGDSAILNSGVFFNEGFISYGEINFYGANIKQNFELRSALIESITDNGLNLQRLKIEGSILIKNVLVQNGQVNLTGVKASGSLTIEMSGFKSFDKTFSLNAQGSEFNGGVFLNYVNFDQQLNLAGLKTLHQLVISGKFNAVDLENVKVEGDVVFCIFALNKINLQGLEYNNVMFAEDPNSRHLAQMSEMIYLFNKGTFNPANYKQFAKTLSSTGRNDDAKKVLIQMEKDRTKNTQFPYLIIVWRFILSLVIDFGYNPLKIIKISICLIIGFTFLICFTGSDFLVSNEVSINPERNALFYSVDTFVPLIDLKQSSFWVPDPSRSLILAVIWWVYVIIGWLFSIILAAAVTGLIKDNTNNI